jgi:hypothetical protein
MTLALIILLGFAASCFVVRIFMTEMEKLDDWGLDH